MSEKAPAKAWVPLESNPDVLTRFAHALGLSPALSLCDVWGLDLLDIVPSPRHAVILLYPLTKTICANEELQTSKFESDSSKQPFFCRQTIRNACGTIALLHAALNLPAHLQPLQTPSFLHAFKQATNEMTPDQRAAHLYASDKLDHVQQRFATQGQSSAPQATDDVDMHFVCFVHHQGSLFQLDGRKEAPVLHGPTTPDSLLQDTAVVIKEQFITLDPNEIRFTILALTDTQQ